jgi:hypothetical protein
MAVKINRMSGGSISEANVAMAKLLNTDSGRWVQVATIDPEGHPGRCLTLSHQHYGEQDFAITISSGEVFVCQERPRGFLHKSTPHLGMKAKGECMGAFLDLIERDLHTYRWSCHLVRESHTMLNVKEIADQIKTNPEISCEFRVLKGERRA